MLKNTIKTSAMAAAMLLCTGAAQAVVQDIAVNGGFETGRLHRLDPVPELEPRRSYPGSFVPTGPAAPGGDLCANSTVPVRVRRPGCG